MTEYGIAVGVESSAVVAVALGNLVRVLADRLVSGEPLEKLAAAARTTANNSGSITAGDVFIATGSSEIGGS